MFPEPITLIIDYPDSYYSDLPEPIRVGYKNLAKLLLRDIGMLLNNPTIARAFADDKKLEIDKIVERHVATSFDVMEDIISGNILSKGDAIRQGVDEEYSVYRLIEKDAVLRDSMEREACCFLQSLVSISLNNRRVMDTVDGNTTTTVEQVNDYMRVNFN